MRRLAFNEFLFRSEQLDSSALTVPTQLAQPFNEPGEYAGDVLRAADVVGEFVLLVDADSRTTQAFIDLATIDTGRSSGSTGPSPHTYRIAPGGYALFYVSDGPGGYAVRVQPLRDEVLPAALDSCELHPGSLFVAMPLQPGSYAVTNRVDGARAELAVSAPTRGNESYRAPGAVSVLCGEPGFEPARIALEFAQPLVIRMVGLGRVTLELGSG